MIQIPRKCLAPALSACLLLLAGCPSGGPGMHAVHGTVSVNGQPVKFAEISFAPNAKGGESGRTMMTSVIEGKYDLQPMGGATSGESTVQVQVAELGDFAPADWNNLTERESNQLLMKRRKVYVRQVTVDKDVINLDLTDTDLEKPAGG